MITFPITVIRRPDGKWVGRCPSLPGCVAVGDTAEEMLALMQIAQADWMDTKRMRDGGDSDE